MALAGSLKFGDVVTHKDWLDGETRLVTGIYEQAFGRGSLRGAKVNVVMLDKPAFPKDHKSISETEDALYDRWMEGGLELVKAGNVHQLKAKAEK